MCRKISAAVSVFMALIMLALCIGLSCSYAFAADGCSLTAVCKSGSNVLSDVDISVYKIGERNPYGGFKLTGDFKNCNVSLDDTSVPAISKAAYSIETYALTTKGITPDATGKSDSNGRYFVSGLSEGIYLVIGKSVEKNNMKYTCSPSIVEIGGFEEKDITVYMKISGEKIPEKDVKYAVRKRWSNDSDNLRPASVTVSLYKNGSLYKKVTLNASNGWYYEWTSSPSDEWMVSETNVSNYMVEYLKSGKTFYVKNTYTPPPPPEETTSTTPNTTETTSPVENPTTVTTVTTVPREELKKRIEEYEDLDEDDFTPDSWKKFEEIFKRAKRILSLKESTDEEIRTVLVELEEARKKLVYGYSSYLPQTGQLWWPVPVLAGSGVVLIALGVRVARRKDSKNEKKHSR